MSSDIGLGYIFLSLKDRMYNKYNSNYNNYNLPRSRFLGFPEVYFAGYVDTRLRYILSQNSSINYYNSSMNTFWYVSTELRMNSYEFFDKFLSNVNYKVNETYRLGIQIGRQLAFPKNGKFLFEFSTGYGFITNYKFDTLHPQYLLSIRRGINILKKN